MKPTLAILLILTIPVMVWAQEDQSTEITDEQKTALVENATSAAPPNIAEDATVVDLNLNVIREGSNGFTCLPDDPEQPGNSPACVDDEWLKFFKAWMGETDYTPKDVGIGYMLAGGSPNSNVDPYAEGPTEDNEWMSNPVPHVMVIVPDASDLEGFNTDPTTGTPWLMWRGTDLAHIMVPMAQ